MSEERQVMAPEERKLHTRKAMTDHGIVPVEVPEGKTLMAERVAEVEAERAAMIVAMNIDARIFDHIIETLRERPGVFFTAYDKKCVLNDDGADAIARSMELSVEEIIDPQPIVDRYIGEKSGRPEWVMKASVRVSNPRTGRYTQSTELCSSEDAIHSYKEYSKDGKMVALASYGERMQRVHAHASTRARKDAIDKMIGLPTLSRKLCDELGLKYEVIEYSKGRFGGGDKDQPQAPKPEPKPTTTNDPGF